MEQRVVTIVDTMVRVDQRVRVARTEIATETSGPACIYAEVEVAKGSVAYVRGDDEVSAPSAFRIFLPPFTLVQACLRGCDVSTRGLAFSVRDVSSIPQQPLLLARANGPMPLSPHEILRALGEADGVNIARAPAPCRLAARTKQILDAEYFAQITLGQLARRMRTSDAVLSRAFKRAYGLPPVRYRHQVRIVDALIRFANGEVPAEVFQDVGFQDLSRFYKVFRRVACAPPAIYRPKKSKNAKT